MISTSQENVSYQIISTTVLGFPVTISAPSLVVEPSAFFEECGTINFHAVLISGSSLSFENIFTITEDTGEVSVTSESDEDIGEYEVIVQASLFDYPEVYLELPLSIEIGQCITEVIETPEDTIDDITYTIGSEPVTIEV